MQRYCADLGHKMRYLLLALGMALSAQSLAALSIVAPTCSENGLEYNAVRNYAPSGLVFGYTWDRGFQFFLASCEAGLKVVISNGHVVTTVRDAIDELVASPIYYSFDDVAAKLTELGLPSTTEEFSRFNCICNHLNEIPVYQINEIPQ